MAAAGGVLSRIDRAGHDRCICICMAFGRLIDSETDVIPLPVML